MLGELIGEERGKRTARRVLEVNGEPKVEVSFEADGKILGLEEHSIVTYFSTVRPDGSLYGEGKAVVATRDGEVGSWVGSGVGKFGEGGAVSYRGAIYFYASSPKLSRLNSMAAVFEFEVDPEGNTQSKIWEWK
jgi:hypothetical protein